MVWIPNIRRYMRTINPSTKLLHQALFKLTVQVTGHSLRLVLITHQCRINECICHTNILFSVTVIGYRRYSTRQRSLYFCFDFSKRPKSSFIAPTIALRWATSKCNVFVISWRPIPVKPSLPTSTRRAWNSVIFEHYVCSCCTTLRRWPPGVLALSVSILSLKWDVGSKPSILINIVECLPRSTISALLRLFPRLHCRAYWTCTQSLAIGAW